MKISEILKMIEENPEIADYNMCLSQYIAIENEQDPENKYQIVTDFPIRGIAADDEGQELRFIIHFDDLNCIENSRDRILKLIKEYEAGKDPERWTLE